MTCEATTSRMSRLPMIFCHGEILFGGIFCIPFWVDQQEQCQKKRMVVCCNFNGFLEDVGNPQKVKMEAFPPVVSRL